MAVQDMAVGKIKAILYFINARGYIHLLPSDEESKRWRAHMRSLGFEMMAAETLHDARKLQKKLQEQLYAEQQAELAKDESLTMMRRKQIRDRMVARRNSSATSQIERDFIDMWLVMREQKHDIFKKRFTSQMGVMDALEYDQPNNRIHDLMDKQ